MQEWLRDNSVNVLEWPNQIPDLNPIEHLWRDLKMAVHRRSPSNPKQLERICREMAANPQSRYAKLVVSYPRRLKAVITTGQILDKETYIRLINYVSIWIHIGNITVLVWHKCYLFLNFSFMLILHAFRMLVLYWYYMYYTLCMCAWQKYKYYILH